jgi:hypothetical protein
VIPPMGSPPLQSSVCRSEGEDLLSGKQPVFTGVLGRIARPGQAVDPTAIALVTSCCLSRSSQTDSLNPAGLEPQTRVLLVIGPPPASVNSQHGLSRCIACKARRPDARGLGVGYAVWVQSGDSCFVPYERMGLIVRCPRIREAFKSRSACRSGTPVRFGGFARRRQRYGTLGKGSTHEPG